MKTIFLTAFILLNVVSLVQAQDRVNIPASPVSNGSYLIFKDKVVCYERGIDSGQRCLPRQQLGWQRQEVARWKNAIRKAADMLPREFFDKVGTTSWEFFIDRNDWATGFAGLTVRINLLSNYENIPEWMTWEPFRKNGFSEAEMIWIALHEMAHNYSLPGWELNILDQDSIEHQTWAKWSWNKKTKKFTLLSGVETNYVIVTKEKETTLYGKKMGRQEDFADTFALYLMWPEYLKDNFPIHHDVIKNILAIEYESVYPMPSSIKSRLTVQSHGEIGS